MSDVGRRFNLRTPVDFVALSRAHSVRLDGRADTLADLGLFELAAEARRRAQAYRVEADRQERAGLNHLPFRGNSPLSEDPDA